MNSYAFDQKKYRQTFKKRSNFFLPISIIVIILLIGVILIFKTNPNNKKHYHFVKIDSFSSYSSANNSCENLLKQNAKAYIHFDGEYHVLIGFYDSKQQAQNVAEKLLDKFPNTEIYTLSFEGFNGKNQLSKSQNNTIFDTIDCIENSIKTLNNTMLKYEKNELSNTQFNHSIIKIYDEFTSQQDSIFSALSKPKFHEHRQTLDMISKSIQNIKFASKNEQNPTITIRNEIMKIIFNYSKFCSLF